jgi:class 3 adenylate cyclase
MEIAFLGDTMNTAARVQQACRDIGHRVLASAALVERLAASPPGICKALDRPAPFDTCPMTPRGPAPNEKLNDFNSHNSRPGRERKSQ